jgi:hypothetical protein
LREKVGIGFVMFIRSNKSEWPIEGLQQALEPLVPGVDVGTVYKVTAAQDDYLSDNREGPSRPCWRVTCSGEVFLLPIPINTDRWQTIVGFGEDVVSPQAVQDCAPVLLKRIGQRWEVADPGYLSAQEHAAVKAWWTRRTAPPPPVELDPVGLGGLFVSFCRHLGSGNWTEQWQRFFHNRVFEAFPGVFTTGYPAWILEDAPAGGAWFRCSDTMPAAGKGVIGWMVTTKEAFQKDEGWLLPGVAGGPRGVRLLAGAFEGVGNEAAFDGSAFVAATVMPAKVQRKAADADGQSSVWQVVASGKVSGVSVQPVKIAGRPAAPIDVAGAPAQDATSQRGGGAEAQWKTASRKLLGDAFISRCGRVATNPRDFATVADARELLVREVVSMANGVAEIPKNVAIEAHNARVYRRENVDESRFGLLRDDDSRHALLWVFILKEGADQLVLATPVICGAYLQGYDVTGCFALEPASWGGGEVSRLESVLPCVMAQTETGGEYRAAQVGSLVQKRHG